MNDDWYEDNITSIIGQKIHEMAEAMRLAGASFASLCEAIEELYKEMDIYADPSTPIPITNRIKSLQPRNQIFLKKERRTRQYYPNKIGTLVISSDADKEVAYARQS